MIDRLARRLFGRPPAVPSANVDYNRRLWDRYARRWSADRAAVEDPAVEGESKSSLVHVGDEWGVAADVDRIVEEFIYPFIGPDSVVGEIGVGGGRIAARVVNRCGHLSCFDISPRMLERAQEALEPVSKAEYILLEGSRFGAEFDARFDFVYAFDVFVHLDIHEMWKYFRAFRAILKDGGRAFVHTTNLMAPGGWARFQQQSGYSIEGHHFISPEIVSILAVRSGLQIIKTSAPDPSNFYLNRDYLVILQKAQAVEASSV